MILTHHLRHQINKFTILALSTNLAFSFLHPQNTFQHALQMTTNKDEVVPRTIYEKVLDNPNYPPKMPFKDDDFMRQDESDDAIFYDSPRL